MNERVAHDPYATFRFPQSPQPRRFGREVEYVARIGSTNDLARERALSGAPEGLLVLTNEQVGGRGRRGRVWAAPPGGAILASLVLRPRTPTDEVFAATMVMALAIRAAALAWRAPAVLKWPNDVLCRGRKLAGILCEMSMARDRLDFVIVGFGVNVNFDPAPLGLAEVATSINAEVAGLPPDRATLLDHVLGEAESRYTRWQVGDYAGVWEEWQMALATLGNEVRIDTGEGAPLEGRALRVERDGSLVVHTVGGERRVVAGTVLI